ncbi:MAG: ACT domain-containing protein [Desulfobia sp.]
MQQRYIMTAFGQDRIGIVADVTSIIFEHGCKLEDTEMTRLSNEFSIIFLFSSSNENLEKELDSACRRLEIEKGISAFFRKLEDKPATGQASPANRFVLHMEGMDMGGILFKVSSFLKENNINITYVHSRISPSPLSGARVYHISIDIEIPEDMPLKTLRQGLRRVADEMHVDIEINRE